jgi:hypothetical protein
VLSTAVSVSLAQTATPPDTVTLAIDGRSNATPWVAAVDSFVAVVWGATAEGKTDIYLTMSADGGRSFGAARRVNTIAGEARLGGELPPRVALRTRGTGPPELAVLWTARGVTTEIKLARSLDGGQTFSAPLTLQAAGAPGDRGWGALALGRDGAAHAIWLDHRELAASKSHEHRAQVDSESDGALMAQRSALYFATTGLTPVAERKITPGVCYCCKTALATAPDGALYAAWRHVYPGNLRDIALSVSRDGGRSFSAPARVSEDRWQLNGCPDDGPALAVDAAGAAHIIWPTVVNEPQPHGALFYASTRDGRTFTSRTRVPTMGSAKPSHPQLAVNARGDAIVAWDEVLDGRRTAFVRRLVQLGDRVTFGDAIRLDAGLPAMYPVMDVVGHGFIVAWTSGPPGASVIRVRRL